ncbi:EAL domain-containing protein [Vibrio sp. FNV 38]|nr:EAL domain-containing protein [Vibrio sp. FNV 38]
MQLRLLNIFGTSLLGRMHKVFAPVMVLFFLFISTLTFFMYTSQIEKSVLREWQNETESALVQLPREVRLLDSHLDIVMKRIVGVNSFSPAASFTKETFQALYTQLERLHRADGGDNLQPLTVVLVDAGGNVVEERQHVRASLVSVLLAEAKMSLTSEVNRYHKLLVTEGEVLIVTASYLPNQMLLVVVHPFDAFTELVHMLNERFGQNVSYEVKLVEAPNSDIDLAFPFGPKIAHPYADWFSESRYESQFSFQSLETDAGLSFVVQDPLLELLISIEGTYFEPMLSKLILKFVLVTVFAIVLTILFFHNVVKYFVVTPLDKYARQLETTPDSLNESEIEISELRHSYVSIRESMRTVVDVDSLTGVGSRTFFFAELERLVVKRQGAVPGYLVYLDIDNFKWINSHIDHDTGDRFLLDFSTSVTGLVASYIDRSSQVVFARLAVDQFGLYISHTHSFSQTLQLIQSIQELFHPTYRFEGHELPVSVSIGVVEISHYCQSLGLESLQTQGERALQAAKSHEGSHYQFYNVDIAHQVKKCEMIERELISALIHDNFKLMFMPIVSAKGRRTRGYEVLLRCPALEEMNCCPDDYITQAEKSGLIEEIDLWVLRNSFSVIASLIKNGSQPVVFSINISALELANEQFPSQVAVLLEQYAIDAGQIELEVTETAFVPNDKAGLMVLNALKDLGFRLVLDDFGAGYTSFHQLVHYPFDVLKIDKTFVDLLIEQSTTERSMVDVIYSLAKAHQLELVAEGVENEYQADYLTELGCEMLQGFFFSKPISEDLMRFEVLRRPHLELVTKGAL